MPNLKSAKKRLRQTGVKTLENSARKSRVRTEQRKFLAAVNEGNLEQAQTGYRAFCSALDKAAKRGAIKKNNAVRRKARAAAKLTALAPTT